MKRVKLLAALIVLGITVLSTSLYYASSHREAPITALDRTADITDVYAFRSYDANGQDNNPPSITMILNVDPFLEPANGPTWFPFDPGILYEIKVDNNNDARADVTFQLRFSSQYQLPGVYTALAGFGQDPRAAERAGGEGHIGEAKIAREADRPAAEVEQSGTDLRSGRKRVASPGDI